MSELGSGIAIRAENISKKFLLGRRSTSLKDKLTGFSDRAKEEFWAFEDVSVSVPRGSMLGVIGRNGSGKSTLLRTLCGVYRPTTGRVLVGGRVTALLELGAGFHPELTGRENIYMNGSVVGLDRDFMDNVMDEIIDMADIGSFIDAPIDTYSSGMRARLGFAVSVQMQPEILLADEITAVGDIAFKEHGVRRMNELRERGATIVQVSHSLPMLKKNCDQILWLHHGQMRRLGEPESVIDEYQSFSDVDKSGRMIGVQRKAPSKASVQKEAEQVEVMASNDKNSEWFRRVSLEGPDGGGLVAGSKATIAIDVDAPVELSSPLVRVRVLTPKGRSTGFYYQSEPLAPHGGEIPLLVTIDPLTLTFGRYFFRIDVIDGDEVVATRHESVRVDLPKDTESFAQMDARFGVVTQRS